MTIITIVYNYITVDATIINKLDHFFSSYSIQEFKKGELLLPAEIKPKGIFYIQAGIVREYWISAGGTEVTLNMYKPHAFLPMAWAIAGVKNTHFYAAVTPVTVKVCPKDTFLSFLKEEPDIVYDLLRRIYIGLDGLWTHIESITTGNSHTKLITSLCILAKRFGKQEKDSTSIQLKMSEHDIASYAGMSRETTSRELQKLKKSNLVSFQKGIVLIHNSLLQ